MTVFLNGRFVPEEQALVSVFDRGFLYGDGLFETLRVVNGVPFRWAQYLDRLQRGAQALGIALPSDPAALRDFAYRLLKENQMLQGLLRINLSRGVGARGYSPQGADRPSLVMSLHPAQPLDPPPHWRLITSSVCLLANDRLAQFKTTNKLTHIMARAEAEKGGADEALLLNSDGLVAEGAASNLFWIEGGAVLTTPLASGIVAGVTRSVICELCQGFGIINRETKLTHKQLLSRDGVFLTLSSMGVVEASALDGYRLNRSPLTQRLRQAYLELIRKETGLKSPDTAP